MKKSKIQRLNRIWKDVGKCMLEIIILMKCVDGAVVFAYIRHKYSQKFGRFQGTVPWSCNCIMTELTDI